MGRLHSSVFLRRQECTVLPSVDRERGVFSGLQGLFRHVLLPGEL